MSHTLWSRKNTAGTWSVDVDESTHTATVELNGRHLDNHPVPAPSGSELANQGYRLELMASEISESEKRRILGYDS